MAIAEIKGKLIAIALIEKEQQLSDNFTVINLIAPKIFCIIAAPKIFSPTVQLT